MGGPRRSFLYLVNGLTIQVASTLPSFNNVKTSEGKTASEQVAQSLAFQRTCGLPLYFQASEVGNDRLNLEKGVSRPPTDPGETPTPQTPGLNPKGKIENPKSKIQNPQVPATVNPSTTSVGEASALRN